MPHIRTHRNLKDISISPSLSLFQSSLSPASLPFLLSLPPLSSISLSRSLQSSTSIFLLKAYKFYCTSSLSPFERPLRSPSLAIHQTKSWRGSATPRYNCLSLPTSITTEVHIISRVLPLHFIKQPFYVITQARLLTAVFT